MPKANKLAPFGLRIPPELKSLLIERAQNNRRSMNAEILSLIEYAIKNGNHEKSPTT